MALFKPCDSGATSRPVRAYGTCSSHSTLS